MPSKKSRFLNFDNKNKKLNNTSSSEIYSNCNGESANHHLFAGLNDSSNKSNNILSANNNNSNFNNHNNNNNSNFSTNVKVININYNDKAPQQQQQQQHANNFVDSSIKPVDCNNCSNNYLLANDTNNSIFHIHSFHLSFKYFYMAFLFILLLLLLFKSRINQKYHEKKL